MEVGRRELLIGGLAAATVGSGSDARAISSPLFAGTPLADNEIARIVERVDRPLPDIPVLMPRGVGSLAGVGGKTRLLSLWAVWCVPCLIEIRDLGALRPKVATSKFDIGLVATASGKAFGRKDAFDKLASLGATSLAQLVEAGGGGRAAMELAVPRGGSGFTLPCTLLVTADGRVRGRMFGAPTPIVGKRSEADERPSSGSKIVVGADGRPRALSDADQRQVATTRTAWSGPDGAAFIKALQEGILDHV